MRCTIIAVAVLIGTPALAAPPHDSLVRLEYNRAGSVKTSTGTVVSDGSILAPTPHGGIGMIDDVRAVGADGRVFAVTGVLSFHWTAGICLLAAVWDGAPPPGIEVRFEDHLGDRPVTFMCAGEPPVEASVMDAQAINDSVEIHPNTFLNPDDWRGAAVIDEDGALIAISTSFSFGGRITYGGLPEFSQTFGCVPGAWVKPLFESRRGQPITWAHWCTTAHDERAKIRTRIEEALTSPLDKAVDAAKHYRKLAEDAPWHPDAWLLLAAARWEDGRFDAAYEATQRTVFIDPGSHQAAIGVAAYAIREKDFELAESTMRRALRMRHDDLSDYYQDAHYLFYARLPDEALVAVDKVLQVDPGHAKAKELKVMIETVVHKLRTPEDAG